MELSLLAIRAYLGDVAARNALSDDDGPTVYDLLTDDVLPLDDRIEADVRSLVYDLMEKARQNIELLLKRLESAGYLFCQSDYYTPSPLDASAQMEAFEHKTGLYVPLAYRAWFETVGCVSLMGTHPDWPEITYNGLGVDGHAVYADPLVAYWTPAYGLSTWDEWVAYPEYRWSDDLIMEFAPDPGNKANYSSSGSYNLPTSRRRVIDALVTNDDDSNYRRLFIDHLRDSFGAGGFPGWRDYDNAPRASLDALSTGMHPI